MRNQNKLISCQKDFKRFNLIHRVNSSSLKFSGMVEPNMIWNGPPMGAVLPLVPSLIPVHPQALGHAPNIWNYVVPFQRNPVAPDPYTVNDNSLSYSSKSPIFFVSITVKGFFNLI